MRKLLVLFLTVSVLAAQTKPPQISMSRIPSNAVFGVVDVPRTPLESAWTTLTGRLVWKRIHREFFIVGGRNPICWVENMSHPLPRYLDHDPRNVVLTANSIDFDAVAGDLISYKVAIR